MIKELLGAGVSNLS